MVKIEDVFEEYRQRLLNNNVDILILEIYETFAGTDFIDNTLDFMQILEGKSYKQILEKLKEIKEKILHISTNKYTGNQRLGYCNIVEGYIHRVESELYREKDNKNKLLKQAEEIFEQEKLDVKLAEKWIKKYKRFVIENYKKRSRDYKLLMSCILEMKEKETITHISLEVNKILLRTSISIASELLKYY